MLEWIHRVRALEDFTVAIIKSIPKVMLLLIFMPVLLFAVVLWTPIRKLISN